MTEKKIYRDWDHWWSEGRHGFTSYSRDLVKKIWEDLEPTVMASRDDYKHAFVKLMNQEIEFKKDLTDGLLRYIELYAKEDAPGFWRWYCAQLDSEKPEEKV